MTIPQYHAKEIELFCRAENIETPHVYECGLSKGRVLRYRCLDCGLHNVIPNEEVLELVKENRERRNGRVEE